MIIRSALDDYVLANKKVFKHDRAKSIGASEIGSCARRTWYIKNGQKPDQDYVPEWGAATRGDLIEAHLWEPALRKKYGKKLKLAGQDQTTFFDLPLSATPDGILTGLPSDFLKPLGVPDIGNDCIAIECKSADPRTNLEQAKHHNAMQVQVQMGILRKQTKFKPNYSLLSYIDASFHNRVVEFPIAFDAAMYAASKKRAATILNAEKAKDLRPEGWIAGGSECKHCPYLISCGIERRNLPFQDKPVDLQFRAEMQDMVRSANALEEVVDSNTARLRELQDAIKNRLREKGIRRIPGLLTWSSVKGRIAYDNEAIRTAAIAAGIDVEKYSQVGEPTDRLKLADAGDDL